MKHANSKQKRDTEQLAKVVEMPLRPQSPSAHSATRAVTLRIGSRRYEMKFHSEIREISKAPATIIPLPVKIADDRQSAKSRFHMPA